MERREISALGKRIRMMKRPHDDALNTVRKQQRVVRKPRPSSQVKSIESADFSLDIEQNSEEIIHLETQKKSLAAKLAALTSEYNAEDQKRIKLENELSHARQKTGSALTQSRENEELLERLKSMESRLEKTTSKYNQNLSKLAEMRADLDQLRKERYAYHQVLGDLEMPSNANSGRSLTDQLSSKEDGIFLTSSEKNEVMQYDQMISKKRSTQTPNINDPHTESVLKQTDEYQKIIIDILETLNMKNLPQLFSEAERLERENINMNNYIMESNSLQEQLKDEIAKLEAQYKEIKEQVTEEHEKQRESLSQITKDIEEVNKQINEAEIKKATDESEFSSVYSEIESLFNTLECSWEDSPDEKSTVTTGNAMFALSAIEATVAELMSDPSNKAKVQAQMK